MPPNKLEPGEFETDRKAYEKNCLGLNCSHFEGARDVVDSTQVIVKCAIHDGISAVVPGCPAPEKQSE